MWVSTLITGLMAPSLPPRSETLCSISLCFVCPTFHQLNSALHKLWLLLCHPLCLFSFLMLDFLKNLSPTKVIHSLNITGSGKFKMQKVYLYILLVFFPPPQLRRTWSWEKIAVLNLVLDSFIQCMIEASQDEDVSWYHPAVGLRRGTS
jgi:hypothetical protein